jgi:hypothetical protein
MPTLDAISRWISRTKAVVQSLEEMPLFKSAEHIGRDIIQELGVSIEVPHLNRPSSSGWRLTDP